MMLVSAEPWEAASADDRALEAARLAAESANAAKSDFLTRVSHEIRTPLNAIMGFAEVMMEERLGPIGSPRYKEYLKDIRASGAHVLSLVNDLLDLSKIEAGKMELSFSRVDANAAIAECASIMQAQANQGRVVMRLALARDRCAAGPMQALACRFFNLRRMR
jgi:signal transduction histidine kinase